MYSMRQQFYYIPPKDLYPSAICGPFLLGRFISNMDLAIDIIVKGLPNVCNCKTAVSSYPAKIILRKRVVLWENCLKLVDKCP
jgi:hypothetical protein